MNPGACEQEAMNPSVCEQGFFTPCLEDLLKHRGNNRAYTVIGHTDDSWEVHFEGDAIPTTITIK